MWFNSRMRPCQGRDDGATPFTRSTSRSRASAQAGFIRPPCPGQHWGLRPSFARDTGVGEGRRAEARQCIDLSAGVGDLAFRQKVLDCGCGPGRLTIPTARMVGPTGSVTALDMQPGMLEKARGKADAEGLGNIRSLAFPITDGPAFGASAFTRNIPYRPDARGLFYRRTAFSGGKWFCTAVRSRRPPSGTVR